MYASVGLLKDLYNEEAILCFCIFLEGGRIFSAATINSTFQLSKFELSKHSATLHPTWPRLVADKGGSAHNSDHLVITHKALRQLLIIILFEIPFLTTTQNRYNLPTKFVCFPEQIRSGR